MHKAALLYEISRYSLPIHQLRLVRGLLDAALLREPNALESAASGEEWYFRFGVQRDGFSMYPGTGEPAGSGGAEFTKNPAGSHKPFGKFGEVLMGRKPGGTAFCFNSMITIRVDGILKDLDIEL